MTHADGGKKENIAVRVSGGRREMGASVLRRDFKAHRESCNEFISSSITCRRKSLCSAELVSMKVIARKGRKVFEVAVTEGQKAATYTVSLTKLCDIAS